MKSVRHVVGCWALTILPALPVATSWAARCGEELFGDKPAAAGKSTGVGRPAAPAASAESQPIPAPATAPVDPMGQLQMIAREVARRSASLGASRLLAQAAELDVDEAKGARWPVVALNGGANRVATKLDTGVGTEQWQSTLGVRVSAPLYDGGRVSQIMAYRQELAEAAKLGAAVTEEQVVFEALNAALDRSRYRMQAQVYQQYMRKMVCLVDALERIVAQDKGRASELVQVRKTQAQTELQRDQALALSRQSELKLRYLVGELPMLDEGITIPLAKVPDINEVMRQIEFGYEARQLKLQADASETYVEVIRASQQPQVAWAVTRANGRLGDVGTTSWQAGVTVSYSLFNGFTDETVKQSALRRAQASREQLRALLTSKQSRTAQVHDAALSAFDRAKRYVEVLRDSEAVRNATFQQWALIGKRSLFDVMSAENDHFNLRVAYVNALYDGYQSSAQLRSMGAGLTAWLAGEVR